MKTKVDVVKNLELIIKDQADKIKKLRTDIEERDKAIESLERIVRAEVNNKYGDEIKEVSNMAKDPIKKIEIHLECAIAIVCNIMGIDDENAVEMLQKVKTDIERMANEIS